MPPVAGAILDATGNARGPIWLAIILFALVVPLGLGFQYFKAVRLMGGEKEV